MVILEKEEFYFIFDRLNKIEDVSLLHKKMGLPKDMLFNILGRKIQKDATKRFYVIKKRSPELYKEWKNGKSFCEIAEKLGFPAILTTNFILLERRYTRNSIRAFIKDPESIKNSRIKKELKEAIKKDFVYSPTAHEIQSANGKNAEDYIEEWLDTKKVKYLTENEARKRNHVRTPDFLLEKPFTVKNRKLIWIESKASFGDPGELRKDYRKQLDPYTELFGFGAVVYKYGYVKGHGIKDVLILTKEDLKK